MKTNVSDLYETGLFKKVCDMEEPLTTVRDLLRGLAYIAETLDEEGEGLAIQRIAWLALREWETTEKLRGEIFHLTHPRREEIEKERAGHAQL